LGKATMVRILATLLRPDAGTATVAGHDLLADPAPYVSTAFVPAATMPGWLRGFAAHQPFTPIVETMRGL
jgi:ABC-type Na+ transport system ATPase subunit NatA